MATTYVREPKGTDPASAIRKIRMISKTRQAKKNFSYAKKKQISTQGLRIDHFDTTAKTNY